MSSRHVYLLLFASPCGDTRRRNPPTRAFQHHSYARCACALTVSVRRIHVGARIQQKLDELPVAARKRMVQRCATAAVLPVVGISPTLNKQLRNMKP